MPRHYKRKDGIGKKVALKRWKKHLLIINSEDIKAFNDFFEPFEPEEEFSRKK